MQTSINKLPRQGFDKDKEVDMMVGTWSDHYKVGRQQLFGYAYSVPVRLSPITLEEHAPTEANRGPGSSDGAVQARASHMEEQPSN